jgi:lipid-A-disaccharide synthase-like uncharacterized protein
MSPLLLPSVLLAQATAPAAPSSSSGLLSSWVFWLVVGFTGQAVFTARMLVQWIASERKRDSVVPAVFWWLSLAGGILLLSYAIHQRDPVIIAGQALGSFIYARNLVLIGRRQKQQQSADAARTATATDPVAKAEPLPTADVVSPRAATDGASAIPRPHLATGGTLHESRNGHGTHHRTGS